MSRSVTMVAGGRALVRRATSTLVGAEGAVDHLAAPRSVAAEAAPEPSSARAASEAARRRRRSAPRIMSPEAPLGQSK